MSYFLQLFFFFFFIERWARSFTIFIKDEKKNRLVSQVIKSTFILFYPRSHSYTSGEWTYSRLMTPAPEKLVHRFVISLLSGDDPTCLVYASLRWRMRQKQLRQGLDCVCDVKSECDITVFNSIDHRWVCTSSTADAMMASGLRLHVVNQCTGCVLR